MRLVHLRRRVVGRVASGSGSGLPGLLGWGVVWEHGGVDARWECVFLARHGQTEGNLQRRRQGRCDSALTVRGVEQAQCLAAILRPHTVDAIFASPLGRALTTAEIIAGHLKVSVTVINELTEVHHGQFAGLTDEDILRRYPEEWSRRTTDKYTWTFPDGESYADADILTSARMASGMTSRARRPEAHILPG